MNRVHVASVSLITGLGGFNATWEGLMSGKSAIKPVTRFAADRLNGSMATCIEGLEGERGDRSLVEPILDRLLADFGPVPADSRLILATTKGAIDYIERIKRGVDAETEGFMAESLLRNISCRLGLTATAGGININAACASSTIALGRGASLIAHGQVEAVVVCCLDLVSEFVFSGFSALQGLSRGPCRPFDRGRDGLTLGEGGAALLLMSEGRLRREDRSSLGTILGWGTANDANHITA
ncbi:MAG: beta-ketoacyl-[acyl-carrier-protein] synthase family protein, partial [Nitrospirota bacterium]|nr:beta-ketoacyl-[acyl-carrier-protein] synthase family protein [Nitrospirota bacterium]